MQPADCSTPCGRGRKRMGNSLNRYGLWSVVGFLCLFWLTACNDNSGLQPTSGGKPFEVLVIGTDTTAVNTMRNALTALTETALPQPEPSFDVSVAYGEVDASTQYARSIVVVTTDSTRFTQSSIRYEKNVYARPQMIIYITTPSAEQLKTFLKGKGIATIAELLSRAETNRQISHLRTHHSMKALELAKKQFGYSIHAPEDMLSSKQGKDFLWLSNNANSGMQNICLFYSNHLDSVLKENIKGEKDGMYMKTVQESLVRSHADGRDIIRGLWEMEGDAMGGPFVAHSWTDSLTGKTMTALAFVYAPEAKKRNKMKQLEAVLYTIKK